MPCNVCKNFLFYFAKMVCKAFRFQPPAKEKELEKEIKVDEEKKEPKEGITKHKTSVASVAACGDVRMKLPRPMPTYHLPEVLDSEVDDFDSWNEEVEIVEMESEMASGAKGEYSCYTTAELDQAILEDGNHADTSMGMSRQSDKDVDSMLEFFENSDGTDILEKYFDSNQIASKEELNRVENEHDFRRILEMTESFATLSLEAPSDKDLRTDKFIQKRESALRMMLNISDQSSITTATCANAPNSDSEDVLDYSATHVSQEVSVTPLDENSNIAVDNTSSFVRTLTQVTNEKDQGRFSLCEDEIDRKEDDDKLTESQSTQTDDLSSSSTKKSIGHSPKRSASSRLWTKRRTKSLAHWAAANSGDLGRPFTLSGSLHRGGVAKARVRCTPVHGRSSMRLPASYSLYAFFKHGCCRVGLRPTPGGGGVAVVPTRKRKRQRRPLELGLALEDLFKNQWPTSSLINPTMCGSFRLVEQPQSGPRCDCKQQPAIAIPFLFGIRSSDVIATKSDGSEKAVPKEKKAKTCKDSMSDKAASSSKESSSEACSNKEQVHRKYYVLQVEDEG